MELEYNNNYHIHIKENIVVIWCAKAACTTVNHMFFQHEGLLNEALTYSKWIHDYRRHYHSSFIKNYNNNIYTNSHTKYIQFCVNPYRRVVSSYVHAMNSNTNYIGKNRENMSFYSFLLHILNGTIKHNPHHGKQTFFKSNYDNIHVVKMEKLEKEIPKINKKFNLHYKLYENQNVKKKNNNINYFVGNIKWKNLQNNIPNDYTLFYSKEIKTLVSKIYKEDIINLGYTWDMFVKYENKKIVM